MVNRSIVLLLQSEAGIHVFLLDLRKRLRFSCHRKGKKSKEGLLCAAQTVALTTHRE